MKKDKNIFKIKLIFLASLIAFIGCYIEPVNRGCTDTHALNTDYLAEQNDGSCEYSNVTFYAQYSFLGNFPITRIDVSLNNVDIGSLSTYYPNGVNDCSAVGTVNYKFLKKHTLYWNAVIYYGVNGVTYTNGTITPLSFIECIEVNVTK